MSQVPAEKQMVERRIASGWRIIKNVAASVERDNLSLIAAGLALHALLAVFPALFASVSIYGLLSDPQGISDHMGGLSATLPPSSLKILGGALENIAEAQASTLTAGLTIGFFLALWSARKATVGLMTATNIVFQCEETRSMLRRLLVSLGLTLAAVVGFAILVLFAVVVPAVSRVLGTGEAVRFTLSAAHWLLLWGIIVLGVNVVYRFAPNRIDVPWRWITYGSATTATAWLVGSVTFSHYIGRFGSYSQTYGAIAGVVILLLWLYLSGWAVLIGAEIDAVLEEDRSEARAA